MLICGCIFILHTYLLSLQFKFEEQCFFPASRRHCEAVGELPLLLAGQTPNDIFCGGFITFLFIQLYTTANGSRILVPVAPSSKMFADIEERTSMIYDLHFFFF